jgi:AcrR family transcriptional regulator
MSRHGIRTRDILIDATIRLVTRDGPQAATVRAIAHQSGITEGAVYRHYRSKEELCWLAYKRVVEELLQEKQQLKCKPSPIAQKLRDWIGTSYAYFDRYPEAFTYVLLMPPPAAVPQTETAITSAQGRLFMELISDARAAGEIRDIAPQLALSHFTGLMLNIPRLINEGTLPGPASNYVDEMTNSVCRVLQ